MRFNITRLAAGVSIGGLCVAVLLCGCGSGVNAGSSGSSPTPTPTPSTTNEWTWMSGSNTPVAPGQNGTPASGVPGARISSVSWTDSSGDLWLFGGVGYDSTGVDGDLNDLWEFTPTTKSWTVVNGTTPANGKGMYGTLGIPSTSNLPGARDSSVSWIDSNGNVWLFGGVGYDSSATFGLLNDLWEFVPSAKTWTWVSGSDTVNAIGHYGTQGIAAETNVPGARDGSVSWVDSSGNLWLFGGYDFNDLWEFDQSTKEWTWVTGSSTANASGIYGTLGVGSTNNTPGARSGAVSWKDGNGSFWLFGGAGATLFNDLWKFSPSTKEWQWVGGSSAINALGSYGTKGVAAATNVPGSRENAEGWIDSSGILWLFGGQDDTGGPINSVYFNDLWKYDPSTNEWTWVSGSSTTDAAGVYGGLGVTSAGDVPGARSNAASWLDRSGNLWLFGGLDGSVGGYLNDLWRYQP